MILQSCGLLVCNTERQNRNYGEFTMKSPARQSRKQRGEKKAFTRAKLYSVNE